MCYTEGDLTKFRQRRTALTKELYAVEQIISKIKQEDASLATLLELYSQTPPQQDQDAETFVNTPLAIILDRLLGVLDKKVVYHKLELYDVIFNVCNVVSAHDKRQSNYRNKAANTIRKGVNEGSLLRLSPKEIAVATKSNK